MALSNDSQYITNFYSNIVSPYHRYGFQKHHIIPVQVSRKSCFAKLLKAAQQGGYDPRDFESNGICLPAKERLAIESGRPLHRGPHPQYNDMVSERLYNIEASLRSAPYDCIEVAYRISTMQKALRRMLLNNPSKIKLNKRDPMSKHIDFRQLEADVERLWSGMGKLDN